MAEKTGSLKGYVVGLVLSVVITLLAFAAVGFRLLEGPALMTAVIVLALLQLFVQLKYFLHLSFKSDANWNLFTLIFTVIIVVIVVFGSIWIMYSLDTMMMA